MKDVVVPVASFVADDLTALADTLSVSVDAIAAYFFSREVVHT